MKRQRREDCILKYEDYIQNIKSLRSTYCDTVHYLWLQKAKERLPVSKGATQNLDTDCSI
jgi:hypothetical protein